MPFVPSAGGTPFLFTPSDCTFNDALNADFNQFTTLNSYTPIATAQTGTITSYTSSGKYIKFGKLCYVSINVVWTNVGTASNAAIVTLPFTESAPFAVVGREVVVAGIAMTGQSNAGSILFVNDTGGTPFIVNYNIVFGFIYSIL